MLVLALDTATPDLVTGVIDTATGVVAQKVIPETRHHNEQLVPTVLEVLADAGAGFADLGAIVVGVGPGPFTGLRVGMASAQAFGDALGIPVHGVCSLDAVAEATDGEGALLVAIDARRKEVYWATYRAGERTSGPEVSAPAALDPAEPVDRICIPAKLIDALPEHLSGLPRYPASVTPEALVAVADFSATPGPLTPLYLRRPDAVAPKPVKRSLKRRNGNA